VEGGQIIDTPTHTCDWAPTLIALAGGKVDADWKLDGQDIGGLLRGGAEPADARTLYWRTNAGIAIREGDWKLIVPLKGDKAELFHLAEDPYESKDLASKDPERVAALREKLEAIRAGDDPR